MRAMLESGERIKRFVESREESSEEEHAVGQSTASHPSAKKSSE